MQLLLSKRVNHFPLLRRGSVCEREVEREGERGNTWTGYPAAIVSCKRPCGPYKKQDGVYRPTEQRQRHPNHKTALVLLTKGSHVNKKRCSFEHRNHGASPNARETKQSTLQIVLVNIRANALYWISVGDIKVRPHQPRYSRTTRIKSAIFP